MRGPNSIFPPFGKNKNECVDLRCPGRLYFNPVSYLACFSLAWLGVTHTEHRVLLGFLCFASSHFAATNQNTQTTTDSADEAGMIDIISQNVNRLHNSKTLRSPLSLCCDSPIFQVSGRRLFVLNVASNRKHTCRGSVLNMVLLILSISFLCVWIKLECAPT